RLVAPPALRRSAAPRPRAHCCRPERAGGLWLARIDGAQRFPSVGPHGRRRQPDSAVGAEPCAVGSGANPSRPAGASRAQELGGGRNNYALQAAIIACHARAATADETDWSHIAALYGELAAVAPSPVVELNRAVAIGMAEGRQAALTLVDRLAGEP